MKYYCLILFTLFFLTAWGKDPHPERVYEAYIAEIQKIEDLSEFQFSSYLSKRAQKYTLEQMERAEIEVTNFSITINGKPLEIIETEIESPNMKSEKMKTMFLKIFKSDSVMPIKYSEKWKLDDNTAEWQFVDENHFDSNTQLKDSTLKTIVHFVKEAGWKIDKIERTQTSKDGSSMKATTY